VRGPVLNDADVPAALKTVHVPLGGKYHHSTIVPV
jgi:hypothetical protein